MKMKLLKVVDVCETFKELTNKRYSNWSTALKLTKIYKSLNDNKNFYIDSEKKIINEYALKDDNGKFKASESGNITFESVEIAQKFQEALSELQNTEVEVPDCIEIDINDFKEGEVLSPKEILELSDFIEFVDGKGDE